MRLARRERHRAPPRPTETIPETLHEHHCKRQYEPNRRHAAAAADRPAVTERLADHRQHAPGFATNVSPEPRTLGPRTGHALYVPHARAADRRARRHRSRARHLARTPAP